MGVVASCHNAADAWYVWHRDGLKIKEGQRCCCVQITAPGSYTVEVHSGEEKATSDPVVVCLISELESPTSPVPSTSVKDSHCLLPEKEEITFSPKDEIGRGSFGVVYKGVWAGTNVAVKHVKIRHAKRIQSVVETEVRLQVTKLCDMGLSKLKSAQSLSQTNSTAIPGTPSYMAPECLNNKKATVHSDVWALACKRMELFTEKDSWELLMNEDEMGRDLNNDCNSLTAIMKRKETPGSVESLPSTVGASFQHILTECCQYDLGRRPRAIDLVNAFH